MSFGFEMDLCTGPACPRCGCQDVKVLREPDASGSWWGGGKARCRHCQREFTFRQVPKKTAVEPPMVLTPIAIVDDFDPLADVSVVDASVHAIDLKVVPVVACPKCGETMRVSSTRKNVRHFKCDKCGETAKKAR